MCIRDSTMTQKAMDTFGQIDLLINNAGISHIGLLSDMTSEEWHTCLLYTSVSVSCILFYSTLLITKPPDDTDRRLYY